MVENEIKKQSIQLSRLIVDSEEFRNLHTAQKAVKDDPVAYQIMVDYQKLGMKANNNAMRGIAVSQEEMKAITEQEAKIQGNKTLQHWNNCQNTFSKMMESILTTIQQGIIDESACDEGAYSSDSDHLTLFP